MSYSQHRNKLWLNILEDLGPPKGCYFPAWLIAVHFLIFPLQTAQGLFARSYPFNPLRAVWTIHGVEFTDQFFSAFAAATDDWYKFSRNQDGCVTVTRLHRNKNLGIYP